MKPGKNDPMRQISPSPAEVNVLIALYNGRHYPELESRARLLVNLYPDFGFGWKLLGGALQMQGKNALPAFQKTAELMPGEADAHYNLGVALKSFGLLEDAAASYRRALKIKPDYAEAHSNLGNVLKDLGRLDEAVASYRRSIALKPSSAETHNSLGIALKDLGQSGEAVASYRQALALKPDYADAHYNMGNVLKELGQLSDAVASYRRAIEFKPNFALAHNNLGTALQELGRLDSAAASYRHALVLEPDLVIALNNFAAALKEFGRFDDALANYRRVVELEPGSAEARNKLGKTLHELGQLDKAIDCFRLALELAPNYAEALINWGAVLREQGYFNQARDCYRKAQELGFIGAHVRHALIIPTIMGTQQEILESRAEFERNLDQLIVEQVKLEDPLESAIETNFYLSYHGLNDRGLQIKVAKFYEQACPSLLYTSSHITKPRLQTRKNIRVGFMSAFFTNHPVSFCFSKIIEKLSSREQFDVSLISDRPVDENIYSKFVGERVHLPHKLNRAREVIAGLELDVLIYLDIGMEPLSYFLAFARLARVQCVLGGHPVTTGIANMDYFLSTSLTEPANADSHYSEKLIRFKKATSYFARPTIPSPLKTRRELGLPEGRRLYMCPMKLQKMHPDFDEAIARILTIDEEGMVVLFEDGKFPVWKQNLMKRLEQTIPAGVRERIIFLPWLKSKADFISTLAEADVILDPFHFGSGSTLSFIFATGTPLVTKPGEFMRGRIGMGHCRAMDLMECIAKDTEDYARKAVAIATDRTLRENISRKILENNSVYYENLQAVEELTDFICSLKDSWNAV
jgi:protein O-GlcNAc transferase